MKKINVGLIGFGVVGQGVVKTLLGKRKSIEERTGLSINLVKIADKDLRPRKGISVSRKLLTKDVDSVIGNKDIDVIAELIGGIHPAKEIILKSLMLGKHVVTANKALLAEHGKELFTVASKFGRCLGFEASVGGGIPIIDALKNRLVSNSVDVVHGILNGTCNYILTKMSEESCSFSVALNDARKKGIAERNPKLDINGMDSCHKLVLLALLGFGLNVKPKDVHVEGIDGLDPMDIQYAKSWGYSVKLLAIAGRSDKKLDLRVHPALIPFRTVLASVKDENNAIFVKGDMIGESIFYGKGAGSMPTASSVVSDIVDIGKAMARSGKPRIESRVGFKSELAGVRKIEDLVTRYYVRFSAIDRPGVLAGISKVLADNGISIATVAQKERRKGQPVPIVMLTHYAKEGKMESALKKIDRLSFIKRKTVKIRIVR